jgi:predicted MFS family arabinose efflux permease
MTALETPEALEVNPVEANPLKASPRTLVLVGFAAFASMMSMRACDSILPLLAKEFAVSPGVAAQTMSAFAIAYGALQFFYGPLGDRLGKLRVMSVAVAVCALANLMIALSPSLELMILGRALAGIGGAGIIPLSIALVGDSFEYEHRQEALSRLMIVTITGLIAGQWIGGLIADWAGWRALFLGLAAGFLAITLPLRWVTRDQSRGSAPLSDMPDPGNPGKSSPSTPHPSMARQIQRLIRLRWARRVLAVVAIEGGFAFATLSFIPVFLHDEFGLSITWAGAVMALFGLGGLVYTGFSKALIRHLGERGMAIVGGCAVGAAMGFVAFGPSWEWAAAGCLLGGGGLYMMHNTLQANASQLLPQIRGTSVSLFAACFFIGQSVGVAVEAWAIDHGAAREVFVAAMIALPLLGLWFGQGLLVRDAWQLEDGAHDGPRAHQMLRD